MNQESVVAQNVGQKKSFEETQILEPSLSKEVIPMDSSLGELKHAHETKSSDSYKDKLLGQIMRM